MAIDYTQTVDEGLQVASAVITAAPFTFAGWANLDTTTGKGCFQCCGRDSGFQWFFIEHNGSEMRFNARDASSVDAISSGLGLTTGVWFHYAARANSSTDRRAFHNGVSVATSTVSVTPTSLNTTAIGMIAQGSNGFDEFNGQLEHQAIWNVGLTDEEIASLADGANPKTVRLNALQAYWPLQDMNNLRNVVGPGFGLTAFGASNPTSAGFGAPVQSIMYPGPSLSGSITAVPSVSGAIINHLQGSNMGADLYNGALQ